MLNFKEWIRQVFLKESAKEMELNRILDKISGSENLSDKEKGFLDLYNSIKDKDVQDYVLLSRQTVSEKIAELIDNNAIIICNLADRNGPIGLKIINLNSNWDSEKVMLALDKGEKYSLDDKFLYNLINTGNNKWSLEAHDEYFEKLPISSGN